MGHIICVASQKGGTGKTTSAVNLAASLSLMEKDTLLVDCDPLGSATTGIGVDKGRLVHDLYDALVDRVSAREILVDTVFDRLQMIPARIGLIRAEKSLCSTPNPEQVLGRIIREISRDYAVTIIDSPPGFGFLTKSALAGSNCLLLPLQHQIFSFEGLSQLLLMVRSIQKKSNPGLRIGGIFYTMCRTRPETDPFSNAGALSFLNRKLFKTVIPWDDTLAMAADEMRPAALLDILSKGSVSYMQLARELLDELARHH